MLAGAVVWAGKSAGGRGVGVGAAVVTWGLQRWRI